MRTFITAVVISALLVSPVSLAWAGQDGVPSAPPPEAGNGSGAAPMDPDAVPTDPDAVPAVPMDPNALPVDVERIQRMVSRPPAIRPETRHHVFRTEVFGRNPTIDEILGPDWRSGPTPLGAMTHQEFLDVVTPKDVQGYAMYSNKQAMVVAATSFALQWALRQAVKKLDDARTERQKEAARKEVQEALEALRRARREAGLPER